jgi:hypothetical protein
MAGGRGKYKQSKVSRLRLVAQNATNVTDSVNMAEKV